MEYTTKLLRKLHEKRKILRVIFFACLFFLSSSVLFLYYYSEHISQQILIQQTQDQQLLILRAGELSINHFFGSIKKQLIQLSQSQDIQNQVPGRTQKLFDMVFADNREKQSPLFSIGFLNKQGIVADIVDQDNKRNNIGRSYADRNYFITTKNPDNKGKVLLSLPFFSRGPLTTGRPIVMMTTPIYSTSGQYQGAIFAQIVLDNFANRYLKPLSDSGLAVWLIDSHGTILAGNTGEEKETNLFAYASKNPWQGSTNFVTQLHNALLQDEDRVHWLYRLPTGKIQEQYGATNEIDMLGNKYWMIITSPRDTIIAAATTPLALSVLPVVAVFSALFLGCLFVFIIRFARKEVYVEGFLAGKEAGREEKSKK